ncbi:MAG: glycosyltransferase family 2 protein [Bacteroidota bacterium]
MKISIITVCRNSQNTIQDCIDSVRDQIYPNIEHVIIDGNSDDKTVDIIQSNARQGLVWVSEPDRGIYDAMNKGILMSTGDVIGILNSDDFYSSKLILNEIANTFAKNKCESVFGDVVFVKPADVNKSVRTYSAKNWRPDKFAWGYMPPHPSFFVKKEWFDKYGLYKTDYSIAADYELLIRYLFVHRLNYIYVPIEMVKMRVGGVSTKNWKSNVILNKEIARACKENGLYTNYLMIYSKYFAKVFEYI